MTLQNNDISLLLCPSNPSKDSKDFDQFLDFFDFKFCRSKMNEQWFYNSRIKMIV
ncbi:hypothetical protein Hanom_Chr04g00375781 [Helianthus anomalus]